MTELSADTVNIEAVQTSKGTRIAIEPEYLSYLREHGYVIEDIQEAHAVASNSSNAMHIVLKIQTYDRPHGHPDLDLVADKTDIWCCDCGDFTFRRGADISDGLSKPSQSDACKHIQEVSKVEKAKNDDQQQEIYGER